MSCSTAPRWRLDLLRQLRFSSLLYHTAAPSQNAVSLWCQLQGGLSEPPSLLPDPSNPPAARPKHSLSAPAPPLAIRHLWQTLCLIKLSCSLKPWVIPYLWGTYCFIQCESAWFILPPWALLQLGLIHNFSYLLFRVTWSAFPLVIKQTVLRGSSTVYLHGKVKQLSSLPFQIHSVLFFPIYFISFGTHGIQTAAGEGVCALKLCWYVLHPRLSCD